MSKILDKLKNMGKSIGNVVPSEEQNNNMLKEIKTALSNPVQEQKPVEEVEAPEEDEEFEDIKQKSQAQLIGETKLGADAEIIGFEVSMNGFEYKIISDNPYFKIGTCKLSQQ